MQGIDLIQDFGILLLAAGVSAIVCRRLGLSVIVGYLIAGMAIGPYTPPFSLIADEDRIMALSQVGLVFLMFAIGLGLSLSRFARMGAGTVIATALAALIILILTEIAGSLAGWSPLQAMFVAAMLMVSSSAVIAKIVNELKLTHERTSQAALAVTVLEDVVAVTMLTILGSQVYAGADTGGVGRILGGLSAFVALLVGAGLLLVPRLLRRLEARADPEMQTIIVAGLLFALALSAAKAGYSIALGAFLFGAIVAEIPQKRSVESAFTGLRDVFSSVFFVSIGMMIDLRLIADVWPMMLGLTAFALIARPIATSLALILVGTAPADARRSSLLLTPLGEFSFIIAQLGITYQVLSEAFYPIAVGASILTILATPVINRNRDAILGLVDRIEPRWVVKTFDAYHAWITQLNERPRMSLWRLMRPRLGQIVLEMLFISGLLIFSEPLLAAISAGPIGERIEPATLGYIFWGVIAILVLVPLVAIWRNCAALAMLMAEAWGSNLLPRGLIERALKLVIGLMLASWLYLILPLAAFTEWGWILIMAGAAVIVAVFSRRLIYWHSQWQSSVQEVLADTPPTAGERREQARRDLGESLGEWNVVLADCAVPEGASYAGKTLADLGIRQRFGCSIIEVTRNGHSISAPSSNFAIFPGDVLLLLGEPSHIDSARAFLEMRAETKRAEEAAEGGVLDTCRVTAARAGNTLAELQVAPRTGVRIVGIQRGTERLINPGAAERLQEGDDLLVYGTLPKIRQFRHWLVSGRDAAAVPVP